MGYILLSDMTLPAQAACGFRDKLECVSLLDRLHVPVIALGKIRPGRTDELLVKSAINTAKYACIAVDCGTSKEEILRAEACLRGAKRSRMQLSFPMSLAQMEYFAHKKPPKLLEEISTLTALCAQKSADVEFIACDATRADRDFLCQALRRAIQAGARGVCLCDDGANLLPEEFRGFLQDIKKQVPEMSSVRLSVRCSDEMNLACALGIAALQEGAEEIWCACAGQGTANLRSMANLLHLRGEEMGLATGLDEANLIRLTDRIGQIIHAQTPPAVQTAPAEIPLSAGDDRSTIARAVEKLGYTLGEEDLNRVFDAFLSIAAKKESVSMKELDSIVASHALQVPQTWVLDAYQITCTDALSSTAHLRLKKSGAILEAVSFGDGPIDASFKAIEQMTGRSFDVDDFSLRAVTEGGSAMGETVIRLRHGGKTYSGRGLATDIVGAGIMAYLSALNKICYEEEG